MGVYTGTEISEEGLVLCLDAANPRSYTSGSTTWLDLSGNENNGTLVNGPIYDTGSLGSLNFDGVNDSVSTINSINITGNNPWSISTWVNVNSSEIGAGRKGWIFWEGPVAQGANQLISIGVTSGYVEIAHYANDTIFSNSPIYFDSFQNISVTFDGSVERIYINGIGTDTKNTSLNITNGICYLASREVNRDFLNCKISNFKIYNRTLTPDEIQQNFKATRSRFGI